MGGLHLLAADGVWELGSYAHSLGTGVFTLGAVTDLLAASPVSAAFTIPTVYLSDWFRGPFRVATERGARVQFSARSSRSTSVALPR